MIENRPREILKGLRIAMELTGTKKGIIGIKRKYAKAVGSLKTAINELSEKEIELYPLDNFYPAGDEQVLVYEILGRVVPEGGIPLDVGVVVNKVRDDAQRRQVEHLLGDVPLLGWLSYDADVQETDLSGQVVFDAVPNLVADVDRVAERVGQWIGKPGRQTDAVGNG